MPDVICHIESCESNNNKRCNKESIEIHLLSTVGIAGSNAICDDCKINTSDQDMKEICDEIGEAGNTILEVQKEESKNNG